MDPRRQKIWARAALLLFAALCATWLGTLDYERKISTNILDLIPPAEQAPELALVRGLAGEAQARVMLFAFQDPHAPGTPPMAAAAMFARELARAPEFAAVEIVGDGGATAAAARRIFAHRFELLLPTWLAEQERAFAATGEPAERFSAWLAARRAGELERFLTRPEATALQELLPADPLLLLPELIERARLGAAPGGEAGGQALVWAQIKASPLAEEGQAPVFAAIERAMARVQSAHAGVILHWTGVNRFAAASRARIEYEIALLNTCSLLAVLGVSCVFVRRPLKLLHLVPVIVLATAGAWTAATLLFDRLHILVFVIGSLLAGVAIDYGFYLYMQPPLHPDESYGGKLRRLLKPLLASCLTTVIGFSLLLFSELPLIRQVGVFVAAGLLCALGVAMLYFAQLERPLLEARRIGILDAPARRWPRWLARGVSIAFLAAAAIGAARLQWHDDVRALDLPAPELRANDAALRARFGEAGRRSVFLTRGDTVAAAREHVAALHRAAGGEAASAALLLPTESDWRAFGARVRRLADFGPELRAALARQGFSAEAFTPFFDAWETLRAQPPAADYAAVVREFEQTLTGPLALAANTRSPPYWFLTVVGDGGAAASLREPHTLPLNQLESLNELFTRYRWSALRLSAIGLGLVIASVFAIYPPRRGLRIAVIPAGACLFVLGLLGLLGQTLNLFHLLGAFLGVCLAHNYAIFSSDNAAAGDAPPVPVRLSALSTAASFGVLGLSRIPVIHALGVTVTLIVVVALLAVECGRFLPRRTDA